MHGRFGLPDSTGMLTTNMMRCQSEQRTEDSTFLSGIPWYSTAQVAVSAWQTRQRREGVRTKKDAVGCCCATSTRSRFEMLGMKVL